MEESVYHGLSTRVEARLSRGADPNRVSGRGMTLLQVAACKDRASITAMLLDAGADPEAFTLECPCPPLWIACYLGHRATAQALLVAGADPNARPRGRKDRPLHVAAQRLSVSPAFYQICKLLLHHGADPRLRDARGARPILYVPTTPALALDLQKSMVALTERLEAEGEAGACGGVRTS